MRGGQVGIVVIVEKTDGHSHCRHRDLTAGHSHFHCMCQFVDFQYNILGFEV